VAAKKLRVAILVACVSFMDATGAEAGSPCAPRPVVEGGGVETTTDQVAVDGPLTIASVNIAGRARIADALARWIKERSIDVLFLQEVGHASGDGEGFVTTLSERLGRRFAYAPAGLIGNGHTQGLAIVSRYLLKDLRVEPLEYFRLRFRSRCRIALAATAETASGPVRLVNVHLDTRINSKNRLAQLAPALETLQIFDGARVIGGDFNTMNIRWFRSMWPLPYVQRQSRAVRELLAASELRSPFTASPPTFKFLGFPMRLDWLYFSDLEPLAWGVDRLPVTDHRGVWVRVKRDRR
jgi:endonuclease/exonuclease/phosphatase family metal-dependent hydrolase